MKFVEQVLHTAGASLFSSGFQPLRGDSAQTFNCHFGHLKSVELAERKTFYLSV